MKTTIWCWRTVTAESTYFPWWSLTLTRSQWTRSRSTTASSRTLSRPSRRSSPKTKQRTAPSTINLSWRSLCQWKSRSKCQGHNIFKAIIRTWHCVTLGDKVCVKCDCFEIEWRLLFFFLWVPVLLWIKKEFFVCFHGYILQKNFPWQSSKLLVIYTLCCCFFFNNFFSLRKNNILLPSFCVSDIVRVLPIKKVMTFTPKKSHHWFSKYINYI